MIGGYSTPILGNFHIFNKLILKKGSAPVQLNLLSLYCENVSGKDVRQPLKCVVGIYCSYLCIGGVGLPVPKTTSSPLVELSKNQTPQNREIHGYSNGSHFFWFSGVYRILSFKHTNQKG